MVITTRITGRRNKKRLKSNIKNTIIKIKTSKAKIQALIPVARNILKVISYKYKNYSQK